MTHHFRDASMTRHFHDTFSVTLPCYTTSMSPFHDTRFHDTFYDASVLFDRHCTFEQQLKYQFIRTVAFSDVSPRSQLHLAAVAILWLHSADDYHPIGWTFTRSCISISKDKFPTCLDEGVSCRQHGKLRNATLQASRDLFVMQMKFGMRA